MKSIYLVTFCKLLIRRFTIASFAVLLIWFTALPIYAQTGPTVPTGAQGTTGAIEPTGAQNTGAQEVTGTNSLTGADSTNTNNLTTESSTNSTSTNNADINNDINVDVDTGNVDVNSNTAVGNISTGDINGAVTVINVGNSTLAEGSTIGSQTLDGSDTNQVILDPNGMSTTSIGNSATGQGSTNSNSIDSTNGTDVIVTNNATANNDIDIDVNTGNLDVNQNTWVGNIMTGSTNLAVNLFNLLNLSASNLLLSLRTWNILGGLNGDLVVPELANTTTGQNSTNSNALSTFNNGTVTINQDGSVSNNYNINATTGNNSFLGNTMLGDVQTGTATIGGTTVNVLNDADPTFYLINVFGTWDGSLLGINPGQFLVNEFTGQDSTNTNTVSNSSDNSLEVNNNANATNNININANTGGVNASNNTHVGNVSTGDINIFTNTVNFLNSVASSGRRISLRIINIFGNWIGNATTTSSTETINNQTDSSGSTSDSSITVTTETVGDGSVQQTTFITKRLSRSLRSVANTSITAKSTDDSPVQVAGFFGTNDSDGGISILGGRDTTNKNMPWNVWPFVTIGAVVFVTWTAIEARVQAGRKQRQD